jgi:hypothetical protein
VTIKGRYYYKAEDYEYNRLDLNPLSNKKMLDHMAIFYMVPGADAEDRAVHHLLVDHNGVIRECTQDRGFSHPNLQLKEEDGTFNASTVIGMRYISDVDGVETFISAYTAGYDNSYGYAILAEVSYLDLAWAEDQIVYDVRRPGGTLDPERFDAAVRANPRLLQSIHGYGENGQEIPRNGVVVMSIPITLLSDYGGDLDKDTVQKLATQHLDASIYPLIQWEYPAAQLDVDATASGQLTLSWSWEGPSLTYDLYRRSNPTGSWELINTLTSPAEGVLSYTDTSVDASAVYYYTVGIKDADIAFPYGNSVSAKVKP